MIKLKSIVCLCLIVFSYSLSAQSITKGDIVFRSTFNSPKGRAIWTELASAHWDSVSNKPKTCLYVNGTGMVHSFIDLSPYRGMKLLFRCRAKAENVSMPSVPFLGVKFMVHYKSIIGEFWKNEDRVFGTFDWKDLSFTAIIPDDVSVCDLSLGLQESTGKVWFDSISVTVQDIPVLYKKSRPVFSFTAFRGVMSPMKVKENDIKTLGIEWKANLIRWQINMTSAENQSVGADLIKYSQWIEKKLLEIDSLLTICRKYGVKVVIDLHSVPGGRDNGVVRLFYNKEFNDYFVNLWIKIAKRYKGNRTVWGYDLINEPVQDREPSEGMDYYQTQLKAARAIRAIDKSTPIIFEVKEWDSPSEFSFLKPIPVSNIIYEVHMYEPHAFTHQGVYDNTNGIAYPGIINRTYYDKNTLLKILQPVRNFQLTYNLPIYIGEFSAIRWAPGAAQYIDDCISIFEGYGWNWTYHAYREWSGWDVEYENGISKKDVPLKATVDTDRKKVLLKWFRKNGK